MTLEMRYPNPGRQMPDAQRLKVATIFGQTIAEATSERGAVTIVEQALYAHLDVERQMVDISPIEDESQTQKRARLGGQIARTSRKLQQLLEESLAHSDVGEHDETVATATLPGALAAVAEPDLQLSIDYAGTDEGVAILVERSTSAISGVFEHLSTLERAANAWAKHQKNKNAGRPRQHLHSLVNELDRAWRDILSEDRDAYEKWDKKPGAPNSPLCRIFPEALKALGHQVPDSIPQIVQKILKIAEADQKAWDAEGDRWTAAIERKFGKNALPFGSD